MSDVTYFVDIMDFIIWSLYLNLVTICHFSVINNINLLFISTDLYPVDIVYLIKSL